jgi:hypothetical protein
LGIFKRTGEKALEMALDLMKVYHQMTVRVDSISREVDRNISDFKQRLRDFKADIKEHHEWLDKTLAGSKADQAHFRDDVERRLQELLRLTTRLEERLDARLSVVSIIRDNSVHVVETFTPGGSEPSEKRLPPVKVSDPDDDGDR